MSLPQTVPKSEPVKTKPLIRAPYPPSIITLQNLLHKQKLKLVDLFKKADRSRTMKFKRVDFLRIIQEVGGKTLILSSCWFWWLWVSVDSWRLSGHKSLNFSWQDFRDGLPLLPSRVERVTGQAHLAWYQGYQDRSRVHSLPFLAYGSALTTASQWPSRSHS